ncbi:Very-short-patch-repair endonuclease [Agromyces sp. CF514]|nr:Very-short-patch-repair endonuclease [Agromyces sp. CF514]
MRMEALAVFDGLPIRRTAELYRAGWTAYDLAGAVDAREVERVRQGVFALPGTDAEVVEAARHGGMLSCLSAARRLGLWVLDDGLLHVAVGARARVHRHAGCTCETHRVRSARLGACAPLEHALGQIFVCRGAEDFFVAVESALRLGMLGDAALRRLRLAVPAAARSVIDLARADADSGLESILRFRLLPYGIELQSQVEVPGVGLVDFVLGDRLILEVDGRVNHDGPSMRHKDLRRDAAAAALGFETLRFDYALIIHDWPLVVAAILARHESRLVDGGARRA